MQGFHVGPFYFPPHLLTKGENKTTLLEFTEKNYVTKNRNIYIYNLLNYIMMKRGLKICFKGGVWSFQKVLFLFLIIVVLVGLNGVKGETTLIASTSPENDSTPNEFPIQINVLNDGSSIIEIFASNDSSLLDYENSLIYKNHNIGASDNITYNFTTIPTKVTNDTVVLLHFDNVSDFGENGTKIHDFSPNNLTVSTAGIYAQGKFGYGINSSNGQYTTITNNESLNLTDEGQFTISMWVYWYGYGDTFNGLFSKGYWGTSPYGAFMYSAGNLKWVTEGLSDEQLVTSTSGAVQVNKWTFLTFTWNSTYKSFYKNGDFINGGEATGTLASDTNNLYVGFSGQAGQYFNGIIDDFVIYNHSLSSSEILDLYNKRQTIYWKVKADDDFTNISNFYNKFLQCGTFAACQSRANDGGSIVLAEDISSGTTFNLTQNNTLIDCKGHNFAVYPDIYNHSIVIQNCEISGRAYSKIDFKSGSQNSTFKNNVFNISRYGMEIHSDNVNIINNNFTTMSQGAVNVYADSANITNNIFNYGHQAEIQLESGSSNTIINDNLFNNTFGAIAYYGGTISESLNNTLVNTYNGTMIFFEDNRKNYDWASNVIFNITFKYLNGSICPSCSYNLTSYPSGLDSTVVRSNEKLGILFNATHNGIYGFKLNVTDENNNSEEKRFFFFVNMTTKTERRYLRSNAPTHHQFVNPGGTDTGTLKTAQPTSEETRSCLSWVQLAIDDRLGYFPLFIRTVNISTWYNSSGNIYLGFDLINAFGPADEYDGSLMDYNSLLSGVAPYTWTSVEFNNLNITYDDLWSQYFFGIQLAQVTQDPVLMTNTSDMSFTDFTYLVPTINVTNMEGNAEIFSFTYPSDQRSVNITLSGAGELNISLKMPEDLDDYGGYKAYLDTNECNSTSSSCNLSMNSGGALNFTLALGSEHTLKVSPDDTTNPTITFSCSPTSVTTGETIICSCSATDAIDSSPTVSYTINPSTSSTGTYTTTCTATDDAGNSASSSISYTCSGSGGGTTSFYTKTIVRDDKEFSEIETITKELKKGERIRIRISDKEHYIGVAELTETTATIEIFSTSQKTVFNIGDENKFDVTEDNHYDIYVKLNSMANNKANLTIKSIYEEIPAEEEKEKEPEEKEEIEKAKLFLFVIALIIIILVIIIIIKYKKKIKR